jgi:hypothetical protein
MPTGASSFAEAMRVRRCAGLGGLQAWARGGSAAASSRTSRARPPRPSHRSRLPHCFLLQPLPPSHCSLLQPLPPSNCPLLDSWDPRCTTTWTPSSRRSEGGQGGAYALAPEGRLAGWGLGTGAAARARAPACQPLARPLLTSLPTPPLPRYGVDAVNVGDEGGFAPCIQVGAARVWWWWWVRVVCNTPTAGPPSAARPRSPPAQPAALLLRLTPPPPAPAVV